MQGASPTVRPCVTRMDATVAQKTMRVLSVQSTEVASNPTTSRCPASLSALAEASSVQEAQAGGRSCTTKKFEKKEIHTGAGSGGNALWQALRQHALDGLLLPLLLRREQERRGRRCQEKDLRTAHAEEWSVASSSPSACARNKKLSEDAPQNELQGAR